MAMTTGTWWQRNALLAGLFGPPALWVATRWWLEFQLDRAGVVFPPVLGPASDPDAVVRGLWMGAFAAVVLGGLVWWLMRPGQAAMVRRRWAGRMLLGVWVSVWVAGTGQTLRSHFNRLHLQPPVDLVLRVVAVQVQPASLRSLGGAKVYVDWPSGGGLHTVLLASATEELLRQPPTLALSVAQGHWSGHYVTAWRGDTGQGVPTQTTGSAP